MSILKGERCASPVPLDMLEILINGIFAFTMTIIVKNNIPLPSGQLSEDINFLVNYFGDILYDGINFIFTFILLAFFYILIFEIMNNIRRIDWPYIIGIFGFLLFITFIPLTSLLWTVSDQPIPYGVLFHTNIMLCGILLFSLFYYARNFGNLLNKSVSEELYRNLCFRIIMFPIIGCIGFILDCQDISYGIIPPVFLYLIPIYLNIRYINKWPA